MTEVSVVFPSGGSVDCQEQELVAPNQEFTWRVQSWNPGVTKVKIAFGQGTNFFEKLDNGQTVPSHESPERPLTYSGGFASTTIYGTAPPTSQSVTHKYTVTGVGANIELDPQIAVIVQPPGGGGPSDEAGGG